MAWPSPSLQWPLPHPAWSRWRLTEQLQSTACDALSFEERLGLLVDRETTVRDDRRMTNRLRRAKLRHPNACIEDVDFRHPRGLDKSLVLSFACGRWLREHLNVLITGPCGVGKSWLACALAHQACRDGFSALYLRLPRLLHDFAIARGDATYPKLLASFAKLDLLVLDLCEAPSYVESAVHGKHFCGTRTDSTPHNH